jgi:hypothetical protein
MRETATYFIISFSHLLIHGCDLDKLNHTVAFSHLLHGCDLDELQPYSNFLSFTSS